MQRSLFFLSLFLIGIGQLFSQAEPGLWFQPEANQANLLNPAFTGDKKVVIGLPALGFSIGNSAFAFQDAFLGPEGSNLDIGPLVDQLEPSVYGRGWFDARVLNLAVKIKRLQFGLEYGVKGHAFLRYNRELAELLWYGNGRFVDQTLPLNPELQLSAWQDIGLRVSAPVGEKIRVGARLHYLAGIANVTTDRNNLSLYTAPEFYQVQLEADYLIRSNIDLEGLDTLRTIPNPLDLGANPGYTLDMGINIPLNDQWEIGLSVLNLGTITWQRNARAWYNEGEFEFDGLRVGLDAEVEDFSAELLGDSLLNAFNTQRSEEIYSTPLPVRLFAGITWTPEPWLRLGALYERESFRGANTDAISLHGGVNLAKILYLGVNYTIQPQYENQLGTQIMIQAGPIQLVAMTNNVFTALRYWEAQTANVRLGVNLTFGKADFRGRAEEPNTLPN